MSMQWNRNILRIAGTTSLGIGCGLVIIELHIHMCVVFTCSGHLATIIELIFIDLFSAYTGMLQPVFLGGGQAPL